MHPWHFNHQNIRSISLKILWNNSLGAFYRAWIYWGWARSTLLRSTHYEFAQSFDQAKKKKRNKIFLRKLQIFWWFRCHELIICILRIHQMLSPIFFTIFFHEIFSTWTVEKGNTFLIPTKQEFFLSLLVEKEIITNTYNKFVDSEFEIRENIWWIRNLS